MLSGCRKNPIKLPPRCCTLAASQNARRPPLGVERLQTIDLFSRREGTTEIGPGFPVEGTIP